MGGGLKAIPYLSQKGGREFHGTLRRPAFVDLQLSVQEVISDLAGHRQDVVDVHTLHPPFLVAELNPDSTGLPESPGTVRIPGSTVLCPGHGVHDDPGSHLEASGGISRQLGRPPGESGALLQRIVRLGLGDIVAECPHDVDIGPRQRQLDKVHHGRGGRVSRAHNQYGAPRPSLRIARNVWDLVANGFLRGHLTRGGNPPVAQGVGLGVARAVDDHIGLFRPLPTGIVPEQEPEGMPTTLSGADLIMLEEPRPAQAHYADSVLDMSGKGGKGAHRA